MRSPRDEDLFQLHRIGDPQLSPDGQWVAYTEQYVDAESHAWQSHLWLVAADGSGTPRRLTHQSGKHHSPRWAPDGRRLAFLSNREGKGQVWVLDLAGGEARPVTTGDAEPGEAPAWSPDGGRIAFSAWTRLHERDEVPYPGAPAPAAVGHKPGASARPRVIARTDHKQDATGYYGERFKQLHVVTVGDTPAVPQRVAAMEAHCTAPAWSPDGERLAFIVASEEERHFFAGRDLWVVALATGEAQRLWRPSGYCDDPVWHPDGSRIAVVADDAAHGAYTTTDGLWELEVATGRAVNLTAAFDREVGEAVSSDWRHGGYTGPTWTPEGWLFLARSQGESHIYRAPGEALTTGAVTAGGYSCAAGRLAYQAAAPDQPDRIYVDGREVARPGGPWDQVRLAPARRFQYAGAGGWPVEGWVLMPEGPGPHPAVLCIHGGPHNVYGESFFIQFQLMVAAGYAVVYLNPRGTQAYGQEFAEAVCADWGGADYEDLMLGMDAAIAMGGIDRERLGVTGWSYGGFMTNRIVTRTGRFKAAVSGACISNLHSFWGTSDIGAPFLAVQQPGLPWAEPQALLGRSPLTDVERVTTPVLLLHGEADLRCPVTQSEEFYAALRQLGKTTVLVRYPDEPHSFTQPLHVYDRYRRTTAWFDHYVK